MLKYAGKQGKYWLILIPVVVILLVMNKRSPLLLRMACARVSRL